jgi:hypothetical protein
MPTATVLAVFLGSLLSIMPTTGITLPRDYLYPPHRYVRRGPPLLE